MGSTRRLAHDLMESFILGEDEAWELAKIFEDVELGDQIEEAVFLVRIGKVEDGFKELRLLQRLLNARINKLTDEVTKLQRRT